MAAALTQSIRRCTQTYADYTQKGIKVSHYTQMTAAEGVCRNYQTGVRATHLSC